MSVRAEASGAAVAITKEAKDLWRAAPCAGPLTVVADVYAFDFSVRAAYLDGLRGYFNGASVFLCPEGRADAPCEVEIVAPEGPALRAWRVATTLPNAGAAPWEFGAYRAANYDELIDHPVEGERGSRPAHHRSFAHLPVASRSLRRRAGVPGAIRPLSLSGRGGR